MKTIQLNYPIRSVKVIGVHQIIKISFKNRLKILFIGKALIHNNALLSFKPLFSEIEIDIKTEVI